MRKKMKDKDIEELKEKYTPIIKQIIDENQKFYNMKYSIEFDFFENDDIAVRGVSRNGKICLNIISFDYAYKINQPLQNELFILHEIRHLYQRWFILECKENNKNNEQANQWDYEFHNYIDMNKSLELYYGQYTEFDAFCYSYAVMQYKYGKIDYIELPKYYENNEGFHFMMNKWIEIFNNQKL